MAKAENTSKTDEVKDVQEEAETKEENNDMAMAAKPYIQPGEELVKLTIPMDYSRPNDLQISIQVNGETILVKRGVEVTVKRKFAEAYNNAEKQRGHAMAMIYELSN